MNTSSISNDVFETVHFIPIFTYINLLSDFLIAENYITEANQTNHIPIVNALYEYLQYHRYNKHMEDKLIRRLLHGSDLYGAKNNEKFDVTFVNAMFDHIISSLVFDKYGTIYGFLADVLLRAENLQIDYVLRLIKTMLKSASFENEYGDRSFLTSLSVNKIYSDIILPMFPQTERNVTLMSLDYIHAQAGSMFLRPGRRNTAYYTDSEFYNTVILDKDTLFDEYMITGHVIGKLLQTEKKNLRMIKAFALPALICYISDSKYIYMYENMSNLMFDSVFWKLAYEFLFQYLDKSFNATETQLNNDNQLQLNLALFDFQSPAALGNTLLKSDCDEFNLTAYLKNPENYTCGIYKYRTNLNELFNEQINKIVNLYKKYELQLVGKFSQVLHYLKDVEFTVNLMIPDDGDFSDSDQPYDLLEFYFPGNRTLDYFLVERENYNVTIIKKDKNEKLLVGQIHVPLEEICHNAESLILKKFNDNINETWKNLVNFKAERLQSYLKSLYIIHPNNDNSWKGKWWKEFALSLVPFYPCLSDTSNTLYGQHTCFVNILKLFHKFQNGSKLLINENTQSRLFSLGTRIKSVLFKNISDVIVANYVLQPKKEDGILETNDEIFKHICSSEESALVTQDELHFLENIIIDLEERTNFSFVNIKESLQKMFVLKSTCFRMTDGVVGSRSIFVNTQDTKSDTGYGYKFIFLSENATQIVQLRTDYDFKDEMLLLPINQKPLDDDRKTYIVLNNETLKPEVDNLMYEINNQFRRKYIKRSFTGISIYHDDEKCTDKYYIGNLLPMNVCDREWRLQTMIQNIEEAVSLIKSKTNFSESRIRSVLEKYTFVDITALWEFVRNWIFNEDFQEPDSYDDFIVDYPEVLKNLRYNLRFEKHKVLEHDAKIKINSLYSLQERLKIEQGTTIKNIINDYNDQKATYSASFDDYYAIRNYATTGYTRITGETREAKLMKIALYKLAIRQSDDPLGEFDIKLFRTECRHDAFVQKILSSKRNITLQKFTVAYPSSTSVVKFATYAAPEFRNVIYEMVFDGAYLRAKIENFSTSTEKVVILLPGTEFVVTDIKTVMIGGLGSVLKLTLTYQHKNINMDKHIRYKNIMNEIARIQI